MLDGKVALVTGANHGIGLATVARLAALGADIAGTYLRLDEAEGHEGRPPAYARQRRQGAEAIAATVGAHGRRHLALEVDLADADGPGRLVDLVEAELGGIDVLVHNASGWRKDSFTADPDPWGRPTGLVSAETWAGQFLVDARAGALLIAAVAESHRRRQPGWGRVVTLTSGGPAGFPGEASYGAAKAALENYTMTASIELAPLGITANVVYPPVTDTGWVTPEVIAWLCTPAADLVTGNVVRLR